MGLFNRKNKGQGNENTTANMAQRVQENENELKRKVDLLSQTEQQNLLENLRNATGNVYDDLPTFITKYAHGSIFYSHLGDDAKNVFHELARFLYDLDK